MVKSLSQDDHARIGRAIAEAETRTSGEIFCVIAGRVSSYLDVSLGWSAAAALILPLCLIPLGFDPAWFPGIADSWEAAQLAARDLTVARALGAYAVLQAAVFIVVFLLTRLPFILRLVTPPAIRRARVRRSALQQFLAHGLHATRERTGVLIFLALNDRRAEIIADAAIHARVPETVWGDAVNGLVVAMRQNRMAEGFEAAIAASGAVLAEHFPPRADNPDELPNRLVEI